jgi:histone H3/H4
MAKAKSSKEMLIVASKVREFIKSKGGLTSSELLPALNEKVYCVLESAVERAKGNKRSTVKAQDV